MSLPTWDEIAEEQFWENLPKDLHEEAVKSYLGSNGDAIDARVEPLRSLAQDLVAQKFFGPSLTVSATALEVMIHYFCVRPIVEGAILSELLAAQVTRWIVGARSSDQRRLLPALLRPWGIELDKLLLPDNSPMWEKVQSRVIKKRDEFVHRGDPATEEDARLALECVRSFRTEVVLKFAGRLGFTLEKTGRWAHIILESGAINFGTIDPFA